MSMQKKTSREFILSLRKKFARNFAFNAATRRADESRRKKDEHLRVYVWSEHLMQ